MTTAATTIDTNDREKSSVDSPTGVLDGDVDVQRLFLKLDLRLLPIVTLLFLWSFLDRTNIGNARIAGLTTDLRLVGLQYNICSAIFFVSYALLEVPSNILLKKVRPNLWLTFIMSIWSIIMVAMAFVKNYKQLLITRFLLGVAEAGLFPGVTFYLSQWYPRKFYAQRMGIFISASSLAGAFGGVLAFGIQHLDGISNLHGWSWIFLLEGLATFLCAVVGFIFMPGYPEQAKFLTSQERKYLLDLLAQDSVHLSKDFDSKFIWQALSDYNTYLYTILFLTTVIPGYSFALFVPTIINGLHYSASTAQLMSTPPYIFACIVIIVITRLSDKTAMRGPYVLGIAVCGIIGYAIWYATTSPVAGYIAAFLACAGTFGNIALVLSWAGSNIGGDLKRSVVLAMVIGLGNLGGICSSFVFRAQDAPRYHPGHGTCIGCLCIAVVTALFMTLNYRRLNAIKERGAGAANGKDITTAMDSYAGQGDASPHYRYLL